MHIEALKASMTAELNSVVAPVTNKNVMIAANMRTPLFGSIEDCLKQRKLDGVIIASPNNFHFDQAKACIERGVPVLIEKPVTANVGDAEALMNFAAKRGAKALVGHHRAHNPIIKVAVDEIKRGTLGRLVSYVGSAQFCKPDSYFNDGPWRMLPGGGPILINLIHEVDIMRRLMGEVAAVHAISSNAVRRFKVEDSVAINVMFTNGALGTFMLSDTAATPMSWEQTSGENPSFSCYPDNDCYFVAGTRGSLSIPSMRIKHFTTDMTPSWWNKFKEDRREINRMSPSERQLAHFEDVIRSKVDPLVSIEDGYRNLLVTEAIRKSAVSHSLVEI